MEFHLTTSFTGPWSPGFLADCDAVVGKDSGGMDRLVEHLEIHVGLAFPSDPWSYRVEATVRALRKHVEAHPDVFFARSFARDPRGSATALLAWREAMLLSGWDGSTDVLPERLCVAMSPLSPLKPGRCRSLAERMLDLVAAIEKRGTTSVDRVVCLRPIEEEPPLARRLFDVLEKVGTTFDIDEPTPLDAAQPEKSKLQDSVIHLRGTTPYDTAEAIAAWLQDQDLSRVTIITDGGLGRDLDDALQRYHLPSIGSRETSTIGGPQQFLSLALQIRFGPLNPQRLLELLQVRPSPIPQTIGLPLARVVSSVPGMGSVTWNKALDCGVERLAEDKADAERLRERLSTWLPATSVLIEPNGQLSREEAVRLCLFYEAWAQRRISRDGDEGADARSGLFGAIAFSERLRDLVAVSEQDAFGELEVVELVRAATDATYETGERVAEVGSAFVVHEPAAITQPCETVVWWNFTDTAPTRSYRRLFLSSEIADLAEKGVDLTWRTDAGQNRSRRWKTPFIQADRVICCSFESIQGEPTAPHPVWAELTAGWDDAEKKQITVSPEDLLAADHPVLAVRKQLLDTVALPRPAREWRFPTLDSPFREMESASSLESMAHCPLQHALHYQAKLASAEGYELVDEALIKGNVSHRVLETVFQPEQPVLSPEDAEALAATVYESASTEMAANYNTPELDLDRTSLKNAIVRSAGRFSEFLTLNELMVVSSEDLIEAETALGGIRGFLDFLLRRSDGRCAIIDMKFSQRGDASYAKRIREGRAIQLAVYDQLVPGETPVAYFSLSDGQFISPHPGWLQGVRAIRGNSLEETWDQLHRTLDYFREQFDEQATPATGVPDGGVRYPDIDDGLALDPKCDYCEYAALCGVQWIERGEDEHQRRQRLSRLG